MRDWRPIDWILFALALLAILYVATKLQTFDRLIDVDGFWIAGWMWDHGLDPYGPLFHQLKGGMLPGRETPVSFAYPPHSWAVFAPLGLGGNGFGRTLWKVVNVALFAGGHFLWWRVAETTNPPATRRVAMLVILTCIATGTGLAFYNGQTSFLIWFGLALLAYGLTVERRWLIALALAIVLLKPQLGLVAALVVVIVRVDIVVALMTGAMVVVGSIWPLAIGGIGSMRALAANIGMYRGYTYNLLENMSGVGDLCAHWFGIHPSQGVLEGAAIVTALGLGVVLSRRFPGDPRALMAAILVGIGLFVPMHTYDMLFVPVLALILYPPSRWPALVLAAIGALLFARPENFERLPGVGSFAIVLTIGTILLLILPLIEQLRRSRGAQVSPLAG